MAPIAKNIKINIQSLTYVCPDTPNLSDIRGYNLPRKDQVWFRDERYLAWNWNIDPKEGSLWWNDPKTPDEQKKWFDDELERINFGAWIMINGTPTFFNADTYFYQQWFKMLSGHYPEYKETSLEVFRFWELCRIDPACLGDLAIKGRRLGMSHMAASRKLRILLTEDNKLMGIVSKTGNDAQEMFFMVKNGMEGLPPFMMPDLNKVTESEIHVAKPAKKITKNNTKATNDKGKNNRLTWRDTAENAYDGRGMYDLTIDEAGKFEKVNVLSLLQIISDSLVAGAVVKGKISVFTTVNKGDKGGERFRSIWDNSDHVEGKKDRFGRTTSKLKRIFIPAYRGYLGYIGKYGESIIENPTKEQTEYLKKWRDPETGGSCPDPTIGAKQYLQVNRDMLAHDNEQLAEEKRKNPFEWKEVFEGANNQCHFNLEEVNNQIECIETLLENTGRKENGRRIRFKSPSEWVDDKSGFWYVLQFPDKTHKAVYRGSVKCPDNTDFGAAGMDTYANARATVDKGSDACILIHSRYDSFNPETSDEPVAMFLGRPLTKKEFHDQVFWGLQYFGVRMLAERSPTDWEDYAIEKMLASPLDMKKRYGYLCTTKRADDSEVYGVAPQDKQQREQHLTEMIEYANNKIHKIKFLAILRNMIGFNINNRTDFDACMAWGYSLMAIKESTQQKVKPKNSKLQIIRVFRKTG